MSRNCHRERGGDEAAPSRPRTRRRAAACASVCTTRHHDRRQGTHMPTPLSAPFRLAACALLSLALLVFATPTWRLLAGNVSLASTLDEVDNALRTDNAFILYRYSAALLVCALTFFLWSARGGSGEQQAVDIKATTNLHTPSARPAACPASAQPTAPCTGHLASSAADDLFSLHDLHSRLTAPQHTGSSLSVSLPPDEDPAASSTSSRFSLPATVVGAGSVEPPAAAAADAADASVPLPSERNAKPTSSLGSPAVLAQLLALEQGGLEQCEPLEQVGCECATVQASRTSGPAASLDWADPELQAPPPCPPAATPLLLPWIPPHQPRPQLQPRRRPCSQPRHQILHQPQRCPCFRSGLCRRSAPPSATRSSLHATATTRQAAHSTACRAATARSTARATAPRSGKRRHARQPPRYAAHSRRQARRRWTGRRHATSRGATRPSRGGASGGPRGARRSSNASARCRRPRSSRSAPLRPSSTRNRYGSMRTANRGPLVSC